MDKSELRFDGAIMPERLLCVNPKIELIGREFRGPYSSGAMRNGVSGGGSLRRADMRQAEKMEKFPACRIKEGDQTAAQLFFTVLASHRNGIGPWELRYPGVMREIMKPIAKIAASYIRRCCHRHHHRRHRRYYRCYPPIHAVWCRKCLRACPHTKCCPPYNISSRR
jgi:hypothetical protein